VTSYPWMQPAHCRPEVQHSLPRSRPRPPRRFVTSFPWTPPANRRHEVQHSLPRARPRPPRRFVTVYPWMQPAHCRPEVQLSLPRSRPRPPRRFVTAYPWMQPAHCRPAEQLRQANCYRPWPYRRYKTPRAWASLQMKTHRLPCSTFLGMPRHPEWECLDPSTVCGGSPHRS